MKIMAKSTVTTPKEKTALATSIRALVPGKRPTVYPWTAESAALSARDTRSRKPSTSTKAKERRRPRIAPQIPPPGLGGAPQITLSAPRSSAKAPPAPSSRVMVPRIVAQTLADGLCAFASMACTASAPTLPTRPCTSATIRPCAAVWPNTRPATAMAMTSSGANEKAV